MKDDFKKLIKMSSILLLVMLFLPFIINSGALGPGFILICYFGILYADKLIKSKSPSQISVILQKVHDGKVVAYDYGSLERLTDKLYWNEDNAMKEIQDSHPNTQIKFH